MPEDFNPEFVDLTEVPMKQSQGRGIWLKRFNAIPEGKACMLRYNSRQRAHQVVQTLRSLAQYHKILISTRIIHAEPAIHGTDGWLVYYWKKEDSNV